MLDLECIKNMNNKNTALVITSLIVGIFVGYFIPSTPKNIEQFQTDQLGNTEIFQRKQECQSYRLQLETKLKQLDFFNPETGYQTTNFLEKLFYSPKINSCLYVEKEWGLVNKKLTWENLTLNDALTGEILISSLREIGSEEYPRQEQEFEKYLKDYE